MAEIMFSSVCLSARSELVNQTVGALNGFVNSVKMVKIRTSIWHYCF